MGLPTFGGIIGIIAGANYRVNRKEIMVIKI
jgi:hypothetical protein